MVNNTRRAPLEQIVRQRPVQNAETRIPDFEEFLVDKLKQDVAAARAEKGERLSEPELASVFGKYGLDLHSYQACSPCSSTPESAVFYAGEQKPLIRPQLLPIHWIIDRQNTEVQTKREPWICPDHRARMELVPKVAADYGIQPQSIDWIIIEKWEELSDPDEANRMAEKNSLSFRVVTYTESYARNEAAKRERQALVFLDGTKLTGQEKQNILKAVIGERTNPAYQQTL